MTQEEGDALLAILRCGARVLPSRRVVGADGVNLGERHVGAGEVGVQADCFQQPESEILVVLHSVDERQLIVRLRVSGLAGDPVALLLRRASAFPGRERNRLLHGERMTCDLGWCRFLGSP